MRNLRNKRVTKLKVGDLKKAIENIDDDTEIILGFYRKDEGVYFGYLAEIYTNMKYDSVIKDKLFETNIVELACFDDEYCTYVERKDDQ